MKIVALWFSDERDKRGGEVLPLRNGLVELKSDLKLLCFPADDALGLPKNYTALPRFWLSLDSPTSHVPP
ncbi:unnamed protein product [Dovyalis caffra]|uniref:Photolyase/cryptochrome alpha/beta domain-containing protein n=1 Tax=Dovyalis caffra TaxID=77055 RepID=A0AAV1R5B7_9ROSI|nr:unnamed protein product [Dovyalis caffra]